MQNVCTKYTPNQKILAKDKMLCKRKISTIQKKRKKKKTYTVKLIKDKSREKFKLTSHIALDL